MSHLHNGTSAGRGIRYVLSPPSWFGRIMTTARLRVGAEKSADLRQAYGLRKERPIKRYISDSCIRNPINLAVLRSLVIAIVDDHVRAWTIGNIVLVEQILEVRSNYVVHPAANRLRSRQSRLKTAGVGRADGFLIGGVDGVLQEPQRLDLQAPDIAAQAPAAAGPRNVVVPSRRRRRARGPPRPARRQPCRTRVRLRRGGRVDTFWSTASSSGGVHPSDRHDVHVLF